MDEAVKQRVHASLLLLTGKTPPEVAKTVTKPRRTMYRWVSVRVRLHMACNYGKPADSSQLQPHARSPG